MKISGFETLHCDAGWRVLSFLKLTTNEGLVGWSEYNESYGSPGLTAVIEGLCTRRVVGCDPLRHESKSAELYAMTRQAPGGIAQQAIAAIENALVDIKGKALGVPVYELLGGPIREQLRLYWSHCGSYRFAGLAEHMQREPLRSMDDLEALGREVREQGFTALKTNIFLFDPEPRMYQAGFTRAGGWPELNWDRQMVRALRAQLEAMRAGAGPDVDMLLDLNFNFKTEGYMQITKALDDLGMTWFEIDSFDPVALSHIRRALRTPIASCESLFGTRGFRPYFENYSMDVAIIDVPWNGIWTSYKIAAMAEAYELNCAPHNFYGHLSTMMSAHLCAAIPNFRIMEIDIDDVPWKDDLVTVVPEISNGYMTVPTGPGWGTDINEDAVREHPPKR